MGAISSVNVYPGVNRALNAAGLKYFGIPTDISSNTPSMSQASTGLGDGPRRRLHFQTREIAAISFATIVPKVIHNSNMILLTQNSSFDLFTYYLSMMDSNYIIRSVRNRPILKALEITLAPGRPITARFGYDIIKPDTSILDWIELREPPTPAHIGTGKDIEAYESKELEPMFGGQYFGGISNITISASPQMQEINSVGETYGYFLGQPFVVSVSVNTYEDQFDTYRDFFKDVSNLKSMVVGPFKVDKLKLEDYNPQVEAGGHKQNRISLMGNNIQYQGI